MTKSDQEDRLPKVFSVTAEGVTYDSIVEGARLRGARIFDVSADQIYVKASGFRPGRMTPFRPHLGIEARPETWFLDLVVGVKDRDED